MFRVEFGIVHHGCPTNQLTRQFPQFRFINPGGFVLGPSTVEEIMALVEPSEQDIRDLLDYTAGEETYEVCELIERSLDKAFFRMRANCVPREFCSEVVEKNHGFKIGMETQGDGLERWTVGCLRRDQAEQILKDLEAVGEVKVGRITETSWQELLDGVSAG